MFLSNFWRIVHLTRYKLFIYFAYFTKLFILLIIFFIKLNRTVMCYHIFYRCRKEVKHFWSRIISSIKHTWVYRKMRLLRTEGTLENYIMKSTFGFLGGIFLTYMFFVFFVIQLNFTLSSVTMLCSVLGVILTLGLAFSYHVR